MKQTIIQLPQFRPIFLILEYATLLQYFIYDSELRSVIMIALTQIICIVCIRKTDKQGNTTYHDCTIDPQTFPQVIKQQQCRHIRYIVHAVIISLLDLYPIYLHYDHLHDWMWGIGRYEGGIAITIILVILIFVNFLFNAGDDSLSYLKLDYKQYQETGMTFRDKEEAQKTRIENQKNAAEEQRLYVISQRNEVLGPGHLVVPLYDSTNIQSLVISEERQLIEINYTTYKFTDILSYQVTDNAETITIPGTYEIKTKNGSMLNRAILGNMLAGKTGAIIGGSTATSSIVQTQAPVSYTNHTYRISISVNNFDSPTNGYYFGNDLHTTECVASILANIISRNQAAEASADFQSKNIGTELEKLVALRDNGTLTEKEFKQAKKKLLS